MSGVPLESFSQPHGNSGDFFDTGCFRCHGDATPQNTAAASHLLSKTAGAAPGLIERCNVPTGPIADQTAAAQVCPRVCGEAAKVFLNRRRTGAGRKITRGRQPVASRRIIARPSGGSAAPNLSARMARPRLKALSVLSILRPRSENRTTRAPIAWRAA